MFFYKKKGDNNIIINKLIKSTSRALVLFFACFMMIISTGFTDKPQDPESTEVVKKEKKNHFKYKLLQRRNIERVSVYDRGDILNEVNFTFNRGARENKILDIRLFGDSGEQVIDYNFVGFKNVEYPFRAKINYFTLDRYRTYLIPCEAEIYIEQPGYWEINLVK